MLCTHRARRKDGRVTRSSSRGSPPLIGANQRSGPQADARPVCALQRVKSFLAEVKCGRGRNGTWPLMAIWLLVLDVPECEADAWLSKVWLLGTSCLKFFWVFPAMINRLPWHNGSAKATCPFCPLRRNKRSAPRLTQAITGPISGSASACRPTLSFPSR